MKRGPYAPRQASQRRHTAICQLRNQGLLLKEVAGVLGIAASTVDHHLRQKCGCNGATEAAAATSGREGVSDSGR